MTGLATTPDPPYHAGIFTRVTSHAGDGYDTAARRMVELAEAQPGFLGVESVSDDEGVGITVSYWASTEAIAAWRDHAEHTIARETGRSRWYDGYELRVALVERAASWRRPT